LIARAITLSIVIVTWNTRDLTLACLEQLEGEGLLPDFADTESSSKPRADLAIEVFVVDNGSNDDTVGAIRSRFPGVTLIPLPDNTGFARGANRGLAEAAGDTVLLLNSDARLDRATVERCLAVFEDRPKCGIIGVQLLHPDGRLQNSIHAFPSLATELVHTALLELLWPGRYPSKRRTHAAPIEVEAVLGAALFARREAIEAVGLLDEGYFFFLEETDWCWRMRARGFAVVHVPDARVVHLSGASSKRRDAALTRIEFHRSLYRFLASHRGAGVRELSRALRMTKAALAIVFLSPLALFSARQRARFRERVTLLRWHLRGCPPGIGIASLTH
jgi:GT2 family glycosyltransferase